MAEHWVNQWAPNIVICTHDSLILLWMLGCCCGLLQKRKIGLLLNFLTYLFSFLSLALALILCRRRPCPMSILLNYYWGSCMCAHIFCTKWKKIKHRKERSNYVCQRASVHCQIGWMDGWTDRPTNRHRPSDHPMDEPNFFYESINSVSKVIRFNFANASVMYTQLACSSYFILLMMK